MLSTRFPPHRIIDWIDQAILLTFIAGESLELTALRRSELRKHGIVNATGVLITLREKHLVLVKTWKSIVPRASLLPVAAGAARVAGRSP